MGKKYLLYIHNPLFEKEDKKSAMINELLDFFYEAPWPLKYEGIKKIIKKPEDVKKYIKPNIKPIQDNEAITECPRHHVNPVICRHLH
jgi:hypothetical protein